MNTPSHAGEEKPASSRPAGSATPPPQPKPPGKAESGMHEGTQDSRLKTQDSAVSRPTDADGQRQYDEGVALARSGGTLPLNASDSTAAGYNTIYPRSGKLVPQSKDYYAGAKLAQDGVPLPDNASPDTVRGYHSSDPERRGLVLEKPSKLQQLASDRARADKEFPSNVSRGDPPPYEDKDKTKDALGNNRDAQKEYDAGVALGRTQGNLSSDASDNMRRGYAAVAQPGKGDAGRPGFAPPQADPNDVIMDVLSVKEVGDHTEIIEAGGGRMIFAEKGDVEVLPPLQATPKQARVRLKRDKFVYQ